MGCDIHLFAEKKNEAGEWVAMLTPTPYRHRNYGLFGWLAGVRNYSAAPQFSEPRGIPDDLSESVAMEYESWSGDAHTASWLSVEELAAFNYDAEMEDRRTTVQVAPNYWNGGATAPEGEGKRTTYRDFLGKEWVYYIEDLKDEGAGRIVFWFDN